MAGSKQEGLEMLAALMRGESVPTEQTKQVDPEEVKFATDVGAIVRVAAKRAGSDPAYMVALLHGALGEVLNEIFSDEEDEG